MKKLRLLITAECNRSCDGCCNSVWDLDKLPVIDRFEHYSEIMLTGGEPMLYPFKILDAAAAIRAATYIQPKIYLYTAKCRPSRELLFVLRELDGVTLSLHTPDDVAAFMLFHNKTWHETPHYFREKSMRLNVVAGINMEKVPTEGWITRIVDWVKPEQCPLPFNEEFGRWEQKHAFLQ